MEKQKKEQARENANAFGSFTKKFVDRAEDMVGRQVIVVKNLKPVKLRGIESAGMILAADDGSSIALLGPDKELPAGSQVR